jgi:hypothetical protein
MLFVQLASQLFCTILREKFICVPIVVVSSSIMPAETSFLANDRQLVVSLSFPCLDLFTQFTF